MEERTRFSGAQWYEKATSNSVLIGGAGGIGSWLALFLSRIGLDVFIYDNDVVEKVNMGGQLFQKNHIGFPKVYSVADIIAQFNPTSYVAAKYEKIVRTSYLEDTLVTVAAFDNMEARKVLFDRWIDKTSNHESSIFIDARLLAEQYEIIIVRRNNIQEINVYNDKLLFLDNEVANESCTYKQTSHIAALLGAKITSFITNHFSNLVSEEELLFVPFYYKDLPPINYTITKTAEEIENAGSRGNTGSSTEEVVSEREIPF